MMPQHFQVTGGVPLRGSIRPSGNKNAALPLIAASLLADGPSQLTNVPRITDVDTLLNLVSDLGASVEWTGDNSVRIDPTNLRPQALNREMSAQIRASILLAGPLLARFGRVKLPPPGGDVIGRRRVDTHFLAFEQLGAEVTVGEDYTLEAKRLRGADIFLDEPSVTATENTLMAAVLAEGTTTLRNAASEPHVQDLANGLIGMGAQIDGIGTNVLTVQGVPSLHGATLEVGPDHIEVGSFIGLAAVTNGEVTIEGVRAADLRSILLGFERLGVRPVVDAGTVVVPSSQERRIRPDLGGHIPKLEDGPWPAFPADLMSIAVVVATQCEGMLLVFEKMFESRLYFLDMLIGLGAKIVLCDPHRAVIAGPAQLRGSEVRSPDIRAGMAMLLAALAAEGESQIYNISQIDRGYEDIDGRLRALGAQIERVSADG
ncbi:MAG: UDP-N-acetylglucosamine 1-carboxyvinyltransferase [Gemmatimonadetes bacterium]|nr:UDP-N-acetylglucosamine 1-carboxyvinyltransferase [Gemmatimonadota bacterium]